MTGSIAILLSTYNGEKYIEAQLESLAKQSVTNWSLYIRDDGSADRTKVIIDRFSEKHKNCVVFDDDTNLGAAKSFMEMLKVVEADYYMFCDQDDKWLKDKVKISFETIQDLERSIGEIPTLVYTDAQIADAELNVINSSFINFSGIKSNFTDDKNYVLVTNISPGCTYIFNKKLRDIIKEYPDNIPMHDWWAVLNANKFGKIFFLERADILYRQHSENVIGAQEHNLKFIIKKFVRLQKTFVSQLKQYRFLHSQGFVSNIGSFYFHKIKFALKSWAS